MRHLAIQRLLFAALTLVGSSARSLVIASETKSPKEILRVAGLREHQRHWICREEARLLRQLDRVDKWIDETRKARRKWEALGDEQQRVRERIERANATIDQLDQEIDAVGADALRRQRLEQRQQVLRTAMTRDKQELRQKLDGLNEQSKISMESRRLAHLLAKGESLRIALHATNQASKHWYDKIDSETRGAIAALNDASGQRVELGPIRDYAAEIPAQLEKLSAALDTDATPIYQENRRTRVPVVLNGALRTTFGVEDEIAISIAPAALLKAANVSWPVDADHATVALGDFRVAGPVVRVPRLRVGRLVLRDVEVIAADAEAESAEPLLAAAVFDGKEIAWDFERLRIQTKPPR